MNYFYQLRLFVVIALLGLISQGAGAQTNISGIVNQYAKVKYAAGTKVGITTNPFAAGDRVMVIQMKGATINAANSSAYGSITALNSAGYYEFNTIQGFSGTDTALLASPLCHTYVPGDSVQLIKVAVYSGNVNVNGALTCTAWGPGGVGGVLVMEVSGQLSLAADIDVSNKGFRGGSIFGVTFNCSETQVAVPASADGQKGEGIAQYIALQECGRGRLANGGGGSGGGNTGAGGGANYGAAGDGGFQYSACGTTVLQSYGGVVPAVSSDRAYMGGGGGGPQHDNGYTVYPGGNGGGIIFIKAGTIQGNGHLMISNGQSITNVINDEGTSGGGAGGSVYLLCNNYTTALGIQAKGGAGGSNYNTVFTTACHGPGGGGGGGLVYFSTPAVPGVVTTTLTGGAAGTVNNPASSCYNTTNGAVAGSAGGTLFNLTDYLNNPLGLKDTVMCTKNFNLTLNIGTGFNNILWSTGATTPSIVVTALGIYTVTATTPLGCVVHDTARVTLDTMTLGPDTTICNGASLTLKPRPAAAYTSYQWSTGATTPTIVATANGAYRLTVVTTHGCTLKDTIVVTLDNPPHLRDTAICKDPTPIILDLGPGYASAIWSTVQTGTSVTVTHAGTYTVTGTRTNGCIVKDTVIITKDSLSIGRDTAVCATINYTLTPTPAGNFTTYLWQDGTVAPTYTVTQSGTYILTAHTLANCILSDTVVVAVDSTPRLTVLSADSVLCEGQGLVLTAFHNNDGFLNLAWTLGDGTVLGNLNPVTHAYDTSGTYTVSITAHYRLCPDITFTKDLIIRPFPNISLGPDTSLCPGAAAIPLYNMAANATGAYTWSTGESGPGIAVNTPGTYWATVTQDGCSSTDTIVVRKNCYLDIPNTFTPNGDGLNDYFMPRQLLSAGAIGFKMSIFNRWGQVIYETLHVDGRGWDGRFNDTAQPEGVYVYLTDVLYSNGTREHYTGNVTLLR